MALVESKACVNLKHNECLKEVSVSAIVTCSMLFLEGPVVCHGCFYFLVVTMVKLRHRQGSLVVVGVALVHVHGKAANRDMRYVSHCKIFPKEARRRICSCCVLVVIVFKPGRILS